MVNMAITTNSSGGLVGRNYGTVKNSYGSLSGGTSTGVTGLSTASMTLAANYSNWDFTTPWLIYGGYTAPLLRAFMTPLTITASASGNQTYDGTTTTTLASYTDPGTLSKNLYGSISFELDGSDVGTHSAAASGFYSDQRGYQVSYSFTTNSVTIISDSASSSSSASVPSINTITVADSILSAVTDTSTVVTQSSSAVTDSSAAATDSAATDSEATDPDQETLAGAIQSAAANQAVVSRKQNNTVVPGIADLETVLSTNGSKPAPKTLVAGELIWDNHGSEYTGSQRLQAHPQFQHVLTHADEIQLHVLGTQDNMRFGRFSYEWPLNDSGWRMGISKH
jgi:hypothetical protein